MSAASTAEIVSVAIALGELRPSVVFTGGSVVGLLITDPGAQEPRVTLDVDVYLHDADVLRYHAAEAALRRSGFTQKHDAPVCRWFKNELVVDLMADNEQVLGFTNRWYKLAAEHATRFEIGDVDIRVISAPFFIATKLEAFDDPRRENAGDLLASHDFEDIITVVDGRDSIVDELDTAPEPVRGHLRERIRQLLADPGIQFAATGHTGGDAQRGKLVIDRLRRFVSPAGDRK